MKILVKAFNRYQTIYFHIKNALMSNQCNLLLKKSHHYEVDFCIITTSDNIFIKIQSNIKKIRTFHFSVRPNQILI